MGLRSIDLNTIQVGDVVCVVELLEYAPAPSTEAMQKFSGKYTTVRDIRCRHFEDISTHGKRSSLYFKLDIDDGEHDWYTDHLAQGYK